MLPMWLMIAQGVKKIADNQNEQADTQSNQFNTQSNQPVNNGNVDIIEARDIVADYVPECISLPIENITVRIIR